MFGHVNAIMLNHIFVPFPQSMGLWIIGRNVVVEDDEEEHGHSEHVGHHGELDVGDHLEWKRSHFV